jgi:hypothetical protein
MAFMRFLPDVCEGVPTDSSLNLALAALCPPAHIPQTVRRLRSVKDGACILIVVDGDPEP